MIHKTQKLIEEYLTSCQGLTKNSRTWYKCLLTHFALNCPEIPRQSGPIEAFLGEYDDENRFAHFRALRAFYNVILERHLPELYPKSKKFMVLGLPKKQIAQMFNPLAGMPPRKPRKKIPFSLTVTELAWLLAIPMGARDRALIYLFVDTGIRVGEALNLCHADIRDEFITVDGKTGQREIPLSPEVRDQLRALGRRGKVFKGLKGNLGWKGAYNIVKSVLQRAGIEAKKWGPHTLRHTFGRQYIASGGDLVSLQRLMGHSNIATTRIYAELDLRDITAQHHKFTPLLAAQRSAQGLLFVQAKRPELALETRN